MFTSWLTAVPFVLAAVTGLEVGRRLHRQDKAFAKAQNRRIAARYLDVITDEMIETRYSQTK